MLGTELSAFQGHEDLRRWSQQYFEVWESFEDRIEEIIDAGDKVVSVVNTTARGRASGIEIEWKENFGVWTIRDGRIVRVVWFASRDEALEAAGLSE